MWAGDPAEGERATRAPARAGHAAAGHERADRRTPTSSARWTRSSPRACATTGRRCTSTGSPTPRSTRPSTGRPPPVERHAGHHPPLRRRDRPRRRRGHGLRRPQRRVDAEHRLDLGRPRRRRGQHRLHARLLGRRAAASPTARPTSTSPACSRRATPPSARATAPTTPAWRGSRPPTTPTTSSGPARTSGPPPEERRRFWA